jgi:hypothetical protein
MHCDATPHNLRGHSAKITEAITVIIVAIVSTADAKSG